MDMPDNIIDLLDPATPEKSAKVLYAPARICVKCNIAKAIRDNFVGDSEVCRVCQDLMDQLANIPVERKALSRLLDSIDRGHTVPHASDTLSSIFRHMGGSEGIGSKFKFVFSKCVEEKDYKVAARMLQTAISMNLKVSEKQQELAVETMEPEELREYLKFLYGKHIQISLDNPLALPEPEEPHG